MKLPRSHALALVFALSTFLSTAATFYVDMNCPTPIPPYSDWSTAATNIQDAIDAAAGGDLIRVTNGTYGTGGRLMAGDLTNRVALNKAVTVQSVNGPWVTCIRGAGAINGTAAVRCAWLTNGASLIGFTLTAGATRTSGDTVSLESGGAVWCASSNAIVANCLIVSNTAYRYGGGAYLGTLNNCFISGNYAYPGGASYLANLDQCTVVSNQSPTSAAVYGGVLTNCIVYYNWVANLGGATASHCCTVPAAAGPGNFTNPPQFFVDGIHLAAGSPCIGTGAGTMGGTDLFGRAWNNPPSVGCAEWQPAPAVTAPQMRLVGNPPGFTIGGASFNGAPPLTFQWLQNGAPLQDNGHFSFTQSSNLVATGVQWTDAGGYRLVVSNAFGAVTSAVAQVTVHCADAAGAHPAAPYDTWASAATNIQDAIDVAQAGDIVIVTNGVYATGGKVMAGDLLNRVALNKPIIVSSVNGYAATIIEGAWDPVSTNGPLAVRCAWLTNGASLYGFTLRNGATRNTGDASWGGPLESGGGVWCACTNTLILNSNSFVLDCVLTNNAAAWSGGGISSGTLNNSLLIQNRAAYGAGAYGAILNNCTVISNFITSGISKCGAGTYEGLTANSIVLGNFDGSATPFTQDNYSATYGPSTAKYSFSCTSPLPAGEGNTNADPQFMDWIHLGAGSPCRGAGNPLGSSGTDLDGESWAHPPSMGCDEVVLSNLVGPLSVTVWTSQTNLLVNHFGSFSGTIGGHASSAAWSFGDGTTLTNADIGSAHRWASPGLYPVIFTAYNLDHPAGVSTDLFVMVSPVDSPLLQPVTAAGNGFVFSFSGQTNATYTIQYATNLAPPIGWKTLQTIYSSPGGTVQIQDSSTNPMRLYRVQAQ